MSNRKQTPDILGSVLGGQPDGLDQASNAVPAPGEPSKPGPQNAARTVAKQADPAPEPAPQPTPPAWEYRDVVFDDHDGYIVRYTGTKEMPDWKRRKVSLSAYINRMGAKGWEIVSLAPIRRNQLLVIFKRQKSA